MKIEGAVNIRKNPKDNGACSKTLYQVILIQILGGVIKRTNMTGLVALQVIRERVVKSLCPVCNKVIDARIYQEGKRVMIMKKCEYHGEYKDIYWSDAELYRRFLHYLADGPGIESAHRGGDCPFNCGICETHKTATILANIDVTNRCNLACPICFADAGVGLDEPSMDQIRASIQLLRSQRPVSCPAIQFSGGEPTLREDLPQIVKMAKQMGFAQIQLATNGVKLATSPELCHALVQSGLSTVYLQFDGVTPDPYKTMRGRDLLPIKLQAIENLRAAGQTSIVLVPTLAKGVNDDEVGDIVRFASNNLDIVKGINFQPVSFAGRIDQEKRLKQRITIPDLLMLLEEQTAGEITKDDFYPIPFVAPVSDLIAAVRGCPQPKLTMHPCCGAATYVYISGGRMMPITRFVDVEGLMEKVAERVQGFDRTLQGSLKVKGMILKDLPRFVDRAKAPWNLSIIKLLLSVFLNGTRESLIEFHNNALFIGAMHFQDLYNMDLERLQRCGIHYATPDGRIIPFCAYSIVHRFRTTDQETQKY